MCGPPARERKRVVISGAGPAGLLLSSLLLNKNKDADCRVTYDVTLVDGRADYAGFTKQEMAENHRSWMLGLADHGMDAIRSLPALYENYVKGEGVLLEEFNIYLGKKRMTQTLDDAAAGAKVRASRGEEDTGPPAAFIVDRNFIVAALARYVKETHAQDDNYAARYETTVQYVDDARRRVLVRDARTGAEEYLGYDLLVGCDGVRSVVREALVRRHADFYLEYTDIFADFKQTHVQRPAGVSPTGMSVLADPLPGFQGICLPETGGLVNLAIGYKRNLREQVPAALQSDDYQVVAAYVRENFKAFELVDYDDFAKQWVGQRWNQTGMVHCNFYHSLKAGVVIMGDAAHATSPSIGMGMNTALRDAQVFSDLLADHEDDFARALPAFSAARVKEGNALTDLAHHLYCHDPKHQFRETLHQVIRTFLNARWPRLVAEHPFTMIGRRGVPLSACYARAVDQGIVRKHRAINDRIQMEHFERQAGMVPQPSDRGWTSSYKFVCGATLAGVAAYVYQTMS